MNNLQLFYVD